jgi:glycosyltransferase involved in cell wall biosynthesis
VDGLAFESEDAAALAKHLERLIGDADLRRRLGTQARKTVCQRYSQRRVLAMMDEALGFARAHGGEGR